MGRIGVTAGFLLLAVLSSRAAEAAPQKIALVALEIGGDGAPELRTQLSQSILAGLASANAETMDLDDVHDALRETPELVNCISSTCLGRIGEKLGVDGFVRGKVQAEGSDYTVELELFNRSELIHRIERPCSVCTINELNMLTRSTAKQLLESASDSPIQVTIRTEPSGAELTIDGLSQGRAPFEGPLSPGPHFVIATRPGETVRQRIEVTKASASEPIIVAFPSAKAVPIPVVTRGSSLGVWKWVTAGSGVAALALGGTLLYVDGRPTCDLDDAVCPNVINTRAGGWSSIGIGVALAVSAGYMFYRDRESAASVSAIAAPVPNGGAAALRIEF